MIMTQEQLILKAQDQFEQVKAFVHQACTEGRRLDQVESDLWGRMLDVGRLMLEGYVAGYRQGDLGPTMEYEGRVLRRLDQLHTKRYVSVFGPFAIDRYVYGTRETQKHEVIALDAILALPESEFSYVLQDWDQGFCVGSSYDPSRRTIERILRLDQSILSLEKMSRQMASSVAGFWEAQPAPEPQTEGSVLVLTADGKGVPMRKKDQPTPRSSERRAKGQKANQKRMACVGGVYTIEPFVRTAQDVVNEVLRQQCRTERPQPRNKKLRAELTRLTDGQELNGKDSIFSWFVEQIRSRNGDLGKPIVALCDGEAALWSQVTELMKTVGVAIVCILDLFHVMERLWSAAYCFHPEGSAEAKGFVTERLERLLKGEVGYVMGGLKQMGTKHKLSAAKRKQLERVITYLENHRSNMKYDEYLSQGYPIGSGVIEGACRHVVKDRMEGTGMRWRIAGAQAVLSLRAVYINGDWQDFQAYRICTRTHELYPYRPFVRRLYRKTG
jgi:hypothetical protein